MSRATVPPRLWTSLTGGHRVSPRRTAERGRAGYTLWQRTRASFSGVVLPPRAVPAAVPVPRQAPVRRREAGHGTPGWFSLPPLPTVAALTASGSDTVVLETTAPDGRTTFLLRHPAGDTSEYGLELVVHGGVDADRPLLVTVSYTRQDGRERILLVPLMPARFGPAASYVRLSGFGPGAAWAAVGPAPLRTDTDWTRDTVVDSVRAALNETTRDAWRRVSELVGDDVREAIGSALG
ncbi:hypothetical protein [Streptomyces sp. NPDC094049]|uniref:hypothetical protein n=1 Tax=Streptomyces sp. NPDC094049 TaxID=3154987 RepID=UPI00331D7333